MSARGFCSYGKKAVYNCMQFTAPLRISYLTTLAPKMKISNIPEKYSEKKLWLQGSFKDRRTSDRNRQSSLWARILLLNTHSLTHSEGQYTSLRLRDSELQKLIIPLYSLYNSLYNPTHKPKNDNVKNKKSVQLLL